VEISEAIKKTPLSTKREGSMPANVIVEIARDACVFSFFMEIKRRMININAKSYLGLFLFRMSSIFVYELAKGLEASHSLNIQEAFSRYEDMWKKIKQERHWLKTPSYKSSFYNAVIQKMDIRFDACFYDIRIKIKDGKLLDLDVEATDKFDDTRYWESIFACPEQIFRGMLSVNEMIDSAVDACGKIIKQLENQASGEEYIYPSYKLFDVEHELTAFDKKFIILNYRLVTSILLVSDIFCNNGEDSARELLLALGLKNYLRKYKAIIIEVVGNELRTMQTKYSQGVLSKFSFFIDPNFYKVNRKARNNLHYKSVNILSDEEQVFLDKYQDIYLHIVAESFLENTKIDIDDECRTVTEYLIDCKKRGLTREDVLANHESLYLEYCNRTQSCK